VSHAVSQSCEIAIPVGSRTEEDKGCIPTGVCNCSMSGDFFAYLELSWGALKMQDVKMTDQVARHENAGHEGAGHEFFIF